MQYVVLTSLLILGLVFTSCAVKIENTSDKYYDRANSANKKSLESLERDTK